MNSPTESWLTTAKRSSFLTIVHTASKSSTTTESISVRSEGKVRIVLDFFQFSINITKQIVGLRVGLGFNKNYLVLLASLVCILFRHYQLSHRRRHQLGRRDCYRRQPQQLQPHHLLARRTGSIHYTLENLWGAVLAFC